MESGEQQKQKDFCLHYSAGLLGISIQPRLQEAARPSGYRQVLGGMLDLGWTWSRKGLTCQPFEASWAHCGQGAPQPVGTWSFTGITQKAKLFHR